MLNCMLCLFLYDTLKEKRKSSNITGTDYVVVVLQCLFCDILDHINLYTCFFFIRTSNFGSGWAYFLIFLNSELVARNNTCKRELRQ